MGHLFIGTLQYRRPKITKQWPSPQCACTKDLPWRPKNWPPKIWTNQVQAFHNFLWHNFLKSKKYIRACSPVSYQTTYLTDEDQASRNRSEVHRFIFIIVKILPRVTYYFSLFNEGCKLLLKADKKMHKCQTIILVSPIFQHISLLHCDQEVYHSFTGQC